MDTVSKDYIFKEINGQLKYIGDFERLYKNLDDPWGQITLDHYKQRRLFVIKSLIKLNPNSVLDVGCGFGHTTQLINILVTKDVLGIDISSEAVKKARRMFPTVSFKKRDILKSFPDRKFNVVLFNSILWYILTDLDNLIKMALGALDKNGYLVIFQNFIPNQRYGKEIIDGFIGLINYVSHIRGCNLVETKSHNQENGRENGIVILKRRF